MASLNTKRGFNEVEAAAYIGVSRSSLRHGRMAGPRNCRIPPPPFIRVGRKILYLRDDLDSWLESHRHGAVALPHDRAGHQ